MQKKSIQCETMSDGCCLLRLSSFPEIQGDKHTSVHTNSKCWSQDPTPDQPTTENLTPESSGLGRRWGMGNPDGKQGMEPAQRLEVMS